MERDGVKHNVPFWLQDSAQKRVGAFDVCFLHVCVYQRQMDGYIQMWVGVNLCVCPCRKNSSFSVFRGSGTPSISTDLIIQ